MTMTMIRHRLERERLAGVDRLAGPLIEAGLHRALQGLAALLGIAHADVERLDVAHAERGHALVALLHLADGPIEHLGGLIDVGHDRGEQMRNAVVGGQLEHLGIDHQQPAFGGIELVDQRQDHGVDADRLARAGGAGNQQVGHAGEVGDDGLAADAAAERQRERRGAGAEGVAFEDLAEADHLALVVGHLDADGVASGHDGDTHGAGAHRAGDVVGKADDALGLDAAARLELVAGDDGAGTDVADLAFDAEVGEHGLQQAGVVLGGGADRCCVGGSRRGRASTG